MTSSIGKLLTLSSIAPVSWSSGDNLSRLSYVKRKATNFTETSKFYEEILSLKVIGPLPDELIMSDGKVRFIFSLAKDDFNISREISNQRNHIAFGGQSLSSVEDQLLLRSIPYRISPVPGTGYRQLFFQDPDGFHIEIVEAPFRNKDETPDGFSIHHLSHLSHNLREDHVFMTQVLGLEEIHRPPFDVDGAWYTDGVIEYHLVNPNQSASYQDFDTWGILGGHSTHGNQSLINANNAITLV